jgi:hypothetical protein
LLQQQPLDQAHQKNLERAHWQERGGRRIQPRIVYSSYT